MVAWQVAALSRTYAPVIGGTARSMSFERESAAFRLVYVSLLVYLWLTPTQWSSRPKYSIANPYSVV